VLWVDYSLSSPFSGIGPFFCNGTAGRRGDIIVIFFFQELKQVGNEGLFQEVAFEPAVDEEINKAMGAQQRQVLGHIRLADLEGFLEIAYAFNTLREIFKDPEPNGVGDGL
jgi:hypothetical protein